MWFMKNLHTVGVHIAVIALFIIIGFSAFTVTAATLQGAKELFQWSSQPASMKTLPAGPRYGCG